LTLLPNNVQWVRVDMDRLEAKALAATHDIEGLPAIVFFAKRRPTRLLELQQSRSLAAFVERILNPLPSLAGAKGGLELATWLDFNDPFRTNGNATTTAPMGVRQMSRVLALLDGDIDEEDLEELRGAAQALGGRPLSFRFARAADAGARRPLGENPG